MNNVEKAFTYRLYCPRKQVVKRAVNGAFPVSIMTRRFYLYCWGGCVASGACSPWM